MTRFALWCASFGLMLQLVGGPSLALRQQAAATDPLRAAQILCDTTPGQTTHHHVPVPDARQWALLHGWAGMLAEAGGAALPLPTWRQLAMAGGATPLAALAGPAALYQARAPPV